MLERTSTSKHSPPFDQTALAALAEIQEGYPIKPATHSLAAIRWWNDLMQAAQTKDNAACHLAIRTLTGLGGEFTPGSIWEGQYEKLTILSDKINGIGNKLRQRRHLDWSEVYLLTGWLAACLAAHITEKRLAHR